MIQLSQTAKACLVAQLCSVLLTFTATTSATLAGAGINAPTTQSFFNYILLTVFCGSIHIWSVRSSRAKSASAAAAMQNAVWMTNSAFVYIALAFLDVEGNTLVTMAYQYTSISSVTLLDSFTIPVVMVLSWFVFQSRYKSGHILGAILCTSGLAVLVVNDGLTAGGGSNPLLGDILVILGAIVYGICNVAQEKVLSTRTTQWELLTFLGIFGSLISGIQAYVLERQMWFESSSVHWDGSLVGAMSIFALSLFAFYLLVPRVLLMGGSAVLNLNLLTADLWAALSREFLGVGEGFDGWGLAAFLVAFTAELVGLTLYARSGESRQAMAENDDVKVRKRERSEGGFDEEERGLLTGEIGRLGDERLHDTVDRHIPGERDKSSSSSRSEISLTSRGQEKG